MASTNADPRSITRAIQIPQNELTLDDYSPSTHRRRRRGRFSKIPEPVDSSDAGPSSMGSDSSCHSPSARLHPITSSSTHTARDPRLLNTTGQAAIGEENPCTPQRKDKAKAVDRSPPNNLPSLSPSSTSPLGPSMLSSSSYTSINLNSHHDPDEPPRLITYTKSGQGFTWNDELFLPSYMIGRYGGRGRRKQYDGDFGEDEVEVAEIFITDEEAAAMMP